MKDRPKTISKNYFDDEILFKDPITGDLHLKEGVTRLQYRPVIDPYLEESYINQDEFAARRSQQIQERLGINEGDRDNEE
jgi:hypothetical protein